MGKKTTKLSFPCLLVYYLFSTLQCLSGENNCKWHLDPQCYGNIWQNAGEGNLLFVTIKYSGRGRELGPTIEFFLVYAFSAWPWIFSRRLYTPFTTSQHGYHAAQDSAIIVSFKLIYINSRGSAASFSEHNIWQILIQQPFIAWKLGPLSRRELKVWRKNASRAHFTVKGSSL